MVVVLILDESYTIPTYIAQNGGQGNGVYAYARCCNFPLQNEKCNIY